MLGIYGLKERAEDSGPKVKSCPFCGTKNIPGAVNCINKECGMIQDMQLWKAEQEKKDAKLGLLADAVADLHGRIAAMEKKGK